MEAVRRKPPGGSIKAVRRKPPGVLCTRFKSIKNVEPIGNDEVVGI